VTQAVAEETKLEREGRAINTTEEHFRLDIASKSKELANLQEATQAKAKSLATVQSSLRSLQAQVDTLTQEMGTDLADALSATEQRDKERLTREVEAIQRQLAAVSDKRMEVCRCARDMKPLSPHVLTCMRTPQAEKERNDLQSELAMHLHQRQADLKRHLDELAQHEGADKAADLRRQLADAERELAGSATTLQRMLLLMSSRIWEEGAALMLGGAAAAILQSWRKRPRRRTRPSVACATTLPSSRSGARARGGSARQPTDTGWWPADGAPGPAVAAARAGG
jgi:hypothetical protein